MTKFKTFKGLSFALFICLKLPFFAAAAAAHSGGLDSQGCHNQKSTNTYHCHRRSSSNTNTSWSENEFNEALAKQLGGKTERLLTYSFKSDLGELIKGRIRIDIETKTEVIEGGLDKRSSLDSIQQAIFASSLTGKKPAVAIYDTDGEWGKFEHRILTAARKASVKFYWISGGVLQIK